MHSHIIKATPQHICVGVLVICVLLFTVFCIVYTVFLYRFVYVYLFLFITSMRTISTE